MLEHWLTLSLTDGLGPILIARLVDAAGGAEPASGATPSLLRGVEGIGEGRARKIADALAKSQHEVQAELARASSLGIRIICRDDAEYPPLLGHIPDPPP